MTPRVALAVLDPRARRAWPWLPAVAPTRAVLIGPTGEVVRVNDLGQLDPIGPRAWWHRSIAADPCPRPSCAGDPSARRTP